MARVDSGPSLLRVQKFTYDFAVHGGATSTITLGTLPDNAVLTNAYLDGHTAAASDGSATILAKVGANNIQGATAFDAAPFDADDNPITIAFVNKNSGATAVTVTIATAPLTAGAFSIWVEYYQGA